MTATEARELILSIEYGIAVSAVIAAVTFLLTKRSRR